MYLDLQPSCHDVSQNGLRINLVKIVSLLTPNRMFYSLNIASLFIQLLSEETSGLLLPLSCINRVSPLMHQPRNRF